MDRRQLITGLAGTLALGATAQAGGRDTAEGEGFFFRRGDRVHVFRNLRVRERAGGRVELRLGAGDDALTLQGRIPGRGRITLTEGPGITRDRSGTLSLHGGAPGRLMVGESTDPDFFLFFISDEVLGDALVEDTSAVKGNIRRARGRELEVHQARVLVAEEFAFIRLRTRGEETGDFWYVGNTRSRTSPFRVEITHFFRNPGELRPLEERGTATVTAGGRGKLRSLELSVPQDRGRMTATVRTERD